jgi:cytochrome P450
VAVKTLVVSTVVYRNHRNCNAFLCLDIISSPLDGWGTWISGFRVVVRFPIPRPQAIPREYGYPIMTETVKIHSDIVFTLPDGPKSLPIWQLLQWIGNPMGWMEACQKGYGDWFTLQIGALGSIVFCAAPEGIQEIFTADSSTFDAGQSNTLLRPLLGDHSLVLLDGDRHYHQRQLLIPPFHGERMRTYGDLILQITDQVAAAWEVGSAFSVRPAMQDISLQVILQAVFGITDAQRLATLRNLFPKFLSLVDSPLSSSLLFIAALQKDWGSWSPWGRFVQQREQLDQIIYTEISERRRHPDPDRTDILALMLMAKDAEGQGMTDVELRDELITLLLAGHETTASVLGWLLYFIHRFPAVLDRLRQELLTCDDLTDFKAVMKLPYLNAVCQETLRLYPVAPIAFPRILRKPMTIMGRSYLPGTVIAPCIYLTHRRPDLYPEPEQFHPDRFLEKQFSAYEFLPFGGSNRRCIGMAFALFEMKMVLARLLQICEFQLSDQREQKPQRRGVTLAPSGALKLSLVGRY